MRAERPDLQCAAARYQLHRSLSVDCPYENQRQTNSHGDSWQKLSPGARREGFFVGPNGTDCCSGDPVQAAVDIVECRWFYPKR